MNVLDLFSGIGGFSLGLERAGMRTVAFCEIEPYCRTVLKKHWPSVPIYEDVSNLFPRHLADAGIFPEVICGGFPCQDISDAGARAGINGSRSGLWREFARLVRQLLPRYVIVENVAALLGRGHGQVLGDLASAGYDSEWISIPTGRQMGHERKRVFIVAYDVCARFSLRRHADKIGADEALILTRKRFAGLLEAVEPGQRWSDRPLLGRGIHGIPRRVDRIKALGNAVVPQIPEIIGRAIMQAEGLG